MAAALVPVAPVDVRAFDGMLDALGGPLCTAPYGGGLRADDPHQLIPVAMQAAAALQARMPHTMCVRESLMCADEPVVSVPDALCRHSRLCRRMWKASWVLRSAKATAGFIVICPFEPARVCVFETRVNQDWFCGGPGTASVASALHTRICGKLVRVDTAPVVYAAIRVPRSMQDVCSKDVACQWGAWLADDAFAYTLAV